MAGTAGTASGSVDAEELSTGALQWLLACALETSDGLAWSAAPGDDELDHTLYSGGSGIVVTLLEAYQHFGDEVYADAAVRGARSIAAAVDAADDTSHCGLYFGLTGMAFALRAVSDTLNEAAIGAAADRSLPKVRSRFNGERWGDQFELLGGNAGVALGALAAGDPDLAVLAVTPYLRTTESTAGGAQWEVRTGTAARFHHLSHGTLGIVHALASVGRATGRADLVDAALAGAADVVSRNEAGPAGFLVPHSDPQHKPDLIERYSFGWCHGPAGDAQTFRLLGAVTDDPAWRELADRCWHTVIHSGLPHRLRPGFWDNNGRCCGTAGVLALACDRHAEQNDDPGFASVLVDDLAARATVDVEGARWSNHEYRVSPTHLAPRTGWAMGNAGIVRELLRHARCTTGRASAYAVTWPDHPCVPRPAVE